MQIAEHESITALQRLAKRERDGRVRIRLQGVILARQGQTARAIGDGLGVSGRSVRAWVQRYNQAGPSGLEEQPGRGRPSRLDAEQEKRFRARLDAGAKSSDGICSLRGSDLVRILKAEFGVTYTRDGVYGLLKRLGYSYLMPRPQHRKANVVAQAEFKKTLRHKSNG